MMCRNRTKKGFTLVELMIVVAIIGVLASLAIPGFLQILAKSRRAELLSGLAGIYIVEQAYFGGQDIFISGSQMNCVGGPPFDYYDKNFTLGGFFNLSSEAKYYGFCIDIDNTPGSQTFEVYGGGQIDPDDFWDRGFVTDVQKNITYTHDDLKNLP
jgi:prepilin-type N-terminal cleavage/methylation domain-containing protein